VRGGKAISKRQDREEKEKREVGQFQFPQTRFSIGAVASLPIPMTDILKAISKPTAWESGWTSAILCFSAASGYWISGEHKRAICWIVLGTAEVGAILL
jgi:hypothetical protein